MTVLTVLFLLVVAVLLSGLGRAVVLPHTPSVVTEAEPRFVRDLLAGLLVVREIGRANAQRVERLAPQTVAGVPGR